MSKPKKRNAAYLKRKQRQRTLKRREKAFQKKVRQIITDGCLAAEREVRRVRLRLAEAPVLEGKPVAGISYKEQTLLLRSFARDVNPLSKTRDNCHVQIGKRVPGILLPDSKGHVSGETVTALTCFKAGSPTLQGVLGKVKRTKKDKDKGRR